MPGNGNDKDAGGKGKDAQREALPEMMRLVTHHDEIRKEWMRFLITIEGGVVIAIWALITFSKDIPGWLVTLGCSMVGAFGVITAESLLKVIDRIQAWRNYYQRAAGQIAGRLGLEIYPDQEKGTKDVLNRPGGGNVQEILERWKWGFYVVLLGGVLCVAVWRSCPGSQVPKADKETVITVQSNQFEQLLKAIQRRGGTNP